ncbi:biopolymer transporter ExbD [Pseudoalteromonas luteoviolacea]|uniref:ExbD/TolR family protein n=1 Tax=Pseudoalteromonas luteoviolacea TaxID=43657 RepID=UPI001F2B97BE|nr:biopolymer transporter ExbD [Pseudoalteromonas luteoviolacea]MCF6441512.1 biopolymer transporter ExbD [Pseudoalteromonas luteoviolacea]
MDFNQQDAQTSSIKEPNMLPLIDVMLVLLVIVLITSPLLTKALNVDVSNGQAQAVQSAQLTLSINDKGTWLVNGQALNQAQVRHYLTEQAEQTDLSVHLNVGSKTQYQDVHGLMSLLNELNIDKVSFAKQDEQKK